MTVERELIFVYNANAGLINSALDFFHKTFSPKTYACHLCQLTYGVFGMDPTWKKFIESSRIPFRFLHKDEWMLETTNTDDLPAVYERINEELRIVISAEKLKNLSLEELKSQVKILVN